jgi:hypothetical protein
MVLAVGARPLNVENAPDFVDLAILFEATLPKVNRTPDESHGRRAERFGININLNRSDLPYITLSAQGSDVLIFTPFAFTKH